MLISGFALYSSQLQSPPATGSVQHSVQWSEGQGHSYNQPITADAVPLQCDIWNCRRHRRTDRDHPYHRW